MEPRNDVIYTANNKPNLYYYNSNVPAYSGTQSSIRIPQTYRTTLRPGLSGINKNVKKNPQIKISKRKSNQIRRYLFRPTTGTGTGSVQRPQQQPVARNALQMSILLLSILAFGTFATTSIMLGRNNRRNNRREQSAYRIVINKTPRMEDKEANTTTTSSTHWASTFTERLFEFIIDFVQDW